MTTNQAINPARTLPPIGMFSNGLLSKPGRLLSIAGQPGITRHDEQLGFMEQARNCWENIKAILEASGGTMADLVSVTIYFKDATPDLYRILGEVRSEYLLAPYPASTAIGGVQLMLPNMDIEIQAFAVIAES